MKMLANMLEGPAGRRVVDRTGVEAFYSVRWAFAGNGEPLHLIPPTSCSDWKMILD